MYTRYEIGFSTRTCYQCFLCAQLSFFISVLSPSFLCEASLTSHNLMRPPKAPKQALMMLMIYHLMAKKIHEKLSRRKIQMILKFHMLLMEGKDCSQAKSDKVLLAWLGKRYCVCISAFSCDQTLHIAPFVSFINLNMFYSS